MPARLLKGNERVTNTCIVRWEGSSIVKIACKKEERGGKPVILRCADGGSQRGRRRKRGGAIKARNFT